MNESQINVSINIRFHSGDKCLRKNEETPYPLPSAPFPKRKKIYNFSPIFSLYETIISLFGSGGKGF